jgi:hypothetical protein
VRHTTKHEGVAKKLRKLPVVANKQPIVAKKKGHTAEKVVQTVQDELVKLLASGYSAAEVGKVLRSAGIEVSAVTLRGYVRNASKRGVEAGASSVEPAPVKKKVATQKSSAGSTPSETAVAGNAPVSRTKPAPPSATAKARTPAPKRLAKPSTGFPNFGNLPLAKATFVVRPDTPDSDL